ncbi:MAG: dTMP kinase [Chlamydiia bacterium]|nr:dTMP kinase [Chlamydiia bacterium]
MGLFITIEGGEGSGKSTLIQSLAKRFNEEGTPCIVTREPGGTLLGDKVRSLLLEASDHKISPRAEVLLFLASRAEHIEQVIKPALQKDKVVLCDRFIDSTAAYQGYARGLGMDKMRTLSLFASDNLQPDITLYLDIDPKSGLERARNVVKEELQDRFEAEELAFHDKVRRGFLTLADQNSDRIHVLDASLPAETVLENALKVVHGFQTVG